MKKKKVGGSEGGETLLYREDDGSVHDTKLRRIHYGNCGAADAWQGSGAGIWQVRERHCDDLVMMIMTEACERHDDSSVEGSCRKVGR